MRNACCSLEGVCTWVRVDSCKLACLIFFRIQTHGHKRNASNLSLPLSHQRSFALQDTMSKREKTVRLMESTPLPSVWLRGKASDLCSIARR